jgi:hypothetical protein
LVEQHLARFRAHRLLHDLGEGVDLPDHHGRHAVARLPDLLEGALDQPVVVGLVGDEADVPGKDGPA